MKKFSIFLLLVLLLAACATNTSTDSVTAKVYYSSEKHNELIPTDVSVSVENLSDSANELFMKLYSPPQKSQAAAIPQRVKLIDLSVTNGECRIALSPPYLQLSVSKKVAADAAITKTLCSLPGIDKVSILCENESFNFTSEDFLTDIPEAFYEEHSIKLYYPQKDFASVKSDTAVISLSPGETLAEKAVELLQSPPSTSLRSPFPDGTEIYDMTIENGICVLNLSEEFVSNAIHKKKQEGFIVFSIVNTLTELPEIKKVKFLIDGEPSYGYIYYSISTPLRNSSKLFETK